jgi:hypothetical protein
MKVISIHALVVATAALGLLAGCTGGSAEEPSSAPGSSAPVAPATSPSGPPPAEPAAAGRPTPPAFPGPTSSPTPRPPQPVIGRVWTTPRLRCDPACTLTPRVGTVTFHARVSDATRVRFFLVPTGTETWNNREPIAVDRSGEDGWSARYSYADEPLWSHLVVVADGPGGTTEKLPFNLYHPDPVTDGHA